MMTILHDVFAELKSYGIPSVGLMVAVIWVARALGRIEAAVAANKEIAASAVAAAETKIAAAETKIAANKEVADSKIAANKEVADSKIAAGKEVVAEVAKNASMAAELAALKAVRSKSTLVA